MKKLLILICFSLFLPSMMRAQSGMTDDQVMEYIIRENDKGTSRQDIVTQLMKRGVKMDQIQRLRAKYERERGNGQLGTRKLTDADKLEKRLRENNGQDRTSQLRKLQENGRDLTPYQKKMLKEQKEMEYDEGMSFLLPDTLDMAGDFFANKKKQGKQIFGRNIFNREQLNFEPEMNIATPDNYQISAGDEVYVDVWGASQKSFHAQVSADGDIDIEGFGPIHLAGMTVAKANAELRKSLGQYYGGSNIKLTVGQTKTISVNVMGEVVMPGTYSLSAFSTVFHALYMAGGTNDIGSLREIKVYRNHKLVTTVDVYEYILKGNLKGNVRLQSGDVIIVGPYNTLVNISGKVKRPMYYEMRDGEHLDKLLDYAGGFAGDAFRKSMRLVRKHSGMLSVYSVEENERAQFGLCDGDSVFVDSVLNRYTNMVEVRGAIFRPGMYQMDGNITTVGQVLELAGGLSEDAYAQRVIMHRRKADRTLEVLSFNASDLLAHKVQDISLKNEDVIYVPSMKEVLGSRTLRIVGEVNYPGEYEFADNTTIEDLILQAGGLTDAASLVKVDVSRRIRNGQATAADTVVAQQFSFSLKDGFVVRGTPGFALKPFDEVFVRRSPGYIEQEHVEVSGEIVFGGEYVLTKKNQRLSELIKLAGGLTPEAYVQGARLERRLTEAEKLKQRTLLKMATLGDSVDTKKLDLGSTRYVGINLDMAMAHPGSDEWDIVLQPGDKLTIPQFNNTVSISGEVMYPNTVVFKKGEKLKYYINQAGGYSTQAKSSRVFAVNMNGTVTRVKSAKDIQPGCEIIVPAKNKRNRLAFSEIIGMGTMTASLAAVIASLVK